MIVLAPQNWEPVLFRAPHTFGAFVASYILLAVVIVAAGLLALFAHLRERFIDARDAHRVTRRLDIGWQALSVFTLVLYTSMLAACIATTRPFGYVKLDHVSNQHPLQSLSMIFMVLSITVLSERMRVAFLLTITALISILPLVESGSPPTFSDFNGPVLVLCFNLAYLAGSSWLLRQSISLDEAQSLLTEEEIATRRQKAANDAQRRMNNFIHDHVLSALIPMAAGIDNRSALRVTARQALDVLNRRAAGHDIISTTTKLFDQLEQLAIEMDPEIIFRRKEPFTIALPKEVGQSLLDAAHEALTNSLRHAAGPDSPRPRRILSMTSSSRLGVRISISDDGRGFDLAKADASRLGIRHSILQRMDNIGGHVVFDATPGYGTRVLLSYSPTPSPIAQRTESELERHPVATGKVLESPPARIVAGYTIVAHLFQLLSHWNMYKNPWVPVAALILESALLTLLVTRWPEGKLPRWVSILIPLASCVANAAVLFSIPPTGWPENEAWSLGLTTMLCWGLVVREKVLAAWVGMALLVATTAQWVLADELPSVLIFTMTLGHALSLAMWTLITTLARWASVTIFRDEQRRMELEAKRIEDLQTQQIIDSTLDRVEEKVRPLLERIASALPLTSEERQRAALIEAELRDEIRGGSQLAELLGEDVRQARKRGVVVILMNDRGETAIPPELLITLRAHVGRSLEKVKHGRVVIRLVPARADQQMFATFSSSLRTFGIQEDGSVVET